MENIRKFVLVPPELYCKLKKDNLSAIDKQMHEILFDTELSDSEKWKLYSQCLQRYLHFYNEENKDLQLEIIEKGVKSDEPQIVPFDNQILDFSILPQNAAEPSTSGAQTEDTTYANKPSPPHKAMTRVRRKYVPYQHSWERYKL